MVLQNLGEAGMESLVERQGNQEVGSREVDRAYLGLRRASEDEQVKVVPLYRRKHHKTTSVHIDQEE